MSVHGIGKCEFSNERLLMGWLCSVQNDENGFSMEKHEDYQKVDDITMKI